MCNWKIAGTPITVLKPKVILSLIYGNKKYL
jgi:hypothetical protein